MSTLSSSRPSAQTESTDRLGRNTLIMIAVSFAVFSTIDLLRGVGFARDIVLVNAMGAFFLSTPLMLVVAARNVARWNTVEYLGLIVVSVIMVATIGFPVLAIYSGFLHTSAEETGMSMRAMSRFEGFSLVSATFSFVALAAFGFYGTREKVWTAFARQPI